jgi:cytoskeletal protein RodZ
MAQQLSRPFQIALVAVVLLALVWFVALRGHSTSPTTPVASTQASAAAPTTRSSTSASAATTPKSTTRAAVKPHTVKPHVNQAAVGRHSGITAQQAAVESELKQGKVVAVLFWNPKGADDVAVRKELQAVGKKLGGKIAVHTAEANQVGSYGSITRAIQVYQTPTILFVNSKGLTTTLTGFTDAFSIEQTIDEARQA